MRALYDLPAPAKLNLFLHVVGKRPDGYHLLQSLFVPISWADTLHIERRDDALLRRHDLSQALPEDDLCLRAARLLQQASATSLGADIHIEKQVPSGAGMGGGSSDAATVLLALNRLWGLNWPLSRLLPLGLQLGADVPFFLGGRPAWVQGIGEDLLPLALPTQRFAVVKPPASLGTKEIFSSPLLQRSNSVAIVAGFPALNGADDKREAGVGSGGAEAGLDSSLGGGKSAVQPTVLQQLSSGWGRNDLQAAAEAASEQVSEALAFLKQRFGNSRMTGSGSAVFARIESAVMDNDDNDDQLTATGLKGLPSGWVGRSCHSLEVHPLRGWIED
ncbi:4-(cytidine 5'-diphospho)-2-C-methyl-D-erythritol kinase [Roseateles sp. BYS180W]|uniref:4-diphosphocytidyl-2-C-methyl-D-erythritol kinase n=1 Tax=Roseateles rivi TaxID=3299028 RepID=A0ABW7FXC3_9BURK